jgi:hypothetical protein
MGRLISVIFDGPVKPGTDKKSFQANGLPSGMYFCQMVFTTQDGITTKNIKLIIK